MASAELKTELAEFHQFVGDQLARGGASLTPSEALALWQERADTHQAIQEGLDDVAAGRVQPIDEFDRQFRAAHNIETESA